MVDIGTFFIQRAIIHQIPQAKRAAKAEHPILFSEAPSPLDDTKRTYFRKRIVRSLQNAFAVERDSDETSPVPGLMLAHFASSGEDADFVAMSQAIAAHLYACQGGSSSAGLAAVIEGTIASGDTPGKCLAILKLEMEPGIHIEQAIVDGKSTFEVTLEDVTLTETTRVFKAGLFPRFQEIVSLEGRVSDDQLESTTIGREIAEFFLCSFLGCRIRQTPSVQTKRFLESTTDFINGLSHDEVKLQYEVAVRAELESQTPILNPEEFARNYLLEGDRDDFVARFRSDDNTVETFVKDLDLIRAQVTKTWVEFDNGVRVTGPPEAVEQSVRAIRTATDDQGDPIVEARVRRVR
jgi:hypothetical protein